MGTLSKVYWPPSQKGSLIRKTSVDICKSIYIWVVALNTKVENHLGTNYPYTCHIWPAIGLDKSGYQVNSFLISPRKHMLKVLFRSASARCF